MKRLLLLVAIAASACQEARSEPPAAGDAGVPAGPPTVEVVPVVSKMLEKTTPLQGELWAFESVAIHARAAGYIDSIAVDRGSRLRKGQVLAKLSAPELASQRAEAEAKVEGTKSTLTRLQAASKTPGVVAGHDVEQAQAALHADQQKVKSLRTLESYLTVRAPFDGVVTERNVHPGALVGLGGGTPLLKMEKVDRLRLTVAVPESDAGSIAQGARAEFRVRAWPADRFYGVIARISHSVEVRTRTMPVELDVDNRLGKLAPGMFAEVAWPLHRDAPSLFVPAAAVVQTPEMTFVDRVQNNTIERVRVARGAVLPMLIEVFGELHAGDLVLARGSEEMRQGARVNAQAKKPEPAIAPSR